MGEISEITTALAHEIKNPAAVALAHVNLLRLDGKQDKNLMHHLNHIENSITGICKLVQDMLTATHPHDESAEADLHKILTDILETYRAAWPQITFAFDADHHTALPCLGNATSLRMIFSNLIKNAVEATEAAAVNGTITIDTFYTADNLTVVISDTGTATQKPHGNGLGITICQTLAAGIGAHLSAEPHDGGHTVTVSLRTRCPSFA